MVTEVDAALILGDLLPTLVRWRKIVRLQALRVSVRATIYRPSLNAKFSKALNGGQLVAAARYHSIWAMI